MKTDIHLFSPVVGCLRVAKLIVILTTASELTAAYFRSIYRGLLSPLVATTVNNGNACISGW